MTDPSLKWYQRKQLTIIPLIAAVLLVVVLVKTKKGPEKLPFVEQAKPVRVITVSTVDMVPRVIGYGKAKPAEVWQSVAQVRGRIVEISPELKQGNLCKEGTFLARIDPREYELAVVKMEASIEEIKARLTELQVKEKNLGESLSIEKQSLKLSKSERDRQEKLYKKDTVPASKFESEVRNYNSQLLRVQSLKNSLNLVPSSKKQLMAALSLSQANLEDAKRDLENTIIKAPYNCRFTDVAIEAAQYVQKGQVIITADGTSVTEVAAQIPIDKIFGLFSGGVSGMSVSAFDFSKIKDTLGLSAIVRVNSGQFDSEWDARFSRPDAAIDQKTRTAGIIVAVDKPYEKIIMGKRHPLVRNMYCEVEISGKPVPNVIVIPRSAVHQGIVYLVSKENRLVRKNVKTGIPQSGFHVIKKGIEPGERVIISDIIPAIEGMLLHPEEDKDASERLSFQATGKSKVR